MRDPFMFLVGGSAVAAAVGFWIAFNRPGRRPAGKRTGARRWVSSGCVVLAAGGLDIAVAYGLGASSHGGSGITMEMGFAMMTLAAVCSIFREEILRYQLRIGTALYNLPRPAEPALIRAAEYTGVVLRILLFLLGLVIVLTTVVLR